MRKIFGWILISGLILITILPIWQHTVTGLRVILKETTDPITGKVYNIPAGTETVYSTDYTWWILSLSDKNAGMIFGEIVGYVGLWYLAMRLVKRKKQEESKTNEKVETNIN